jgi:hypothetical protein
VRTSITTAQVAPVETTGGEATALAVGVALLFLLLLVMWWQKTSSGDRRGQAGRVGQPERAGGGRSLVPRQRTRDDPALVELDAQASRALLETDNAVRTSEQELGFAVARFGDHAAAPFSRALNSAKEELAAAFQLRQHLDDTAEPARVRQSMLAQIAARCAEANRLLDEQAEDFDRLQDFQAHAPQLLPEVENHITQQAARIDGSQHMLRQLADRYTPGAVTIVATSAAHASARLDVASKASAQARQALGTGDTAAAADKLQVAESSADRAESLLDSIGHLEAELTRASSALPAALRELDADVAESSELLAGQPDDQRAAAAARAQATVDSVRGDLETHAPLDPLAALRELEQAGAALDRALADTRPERVRQEHASGVLDQVMLVARSSVKGTDDFITARRDRVGATARTRLAEAQRHYLEGVAVAQTDPETAVTKAQDADALAVEAWMLAEQDLRRGGGDGRSGAVPGGFGGAATRDRRELASQR